MCTTTDYRHTRWAIEKLKSCEYFPNLRRLTEEYEDFKMNILSLIKKENYYALVDKSFRLLLQEKIPTRKNIAKILKTSEKTLYRIVKKDNYWCNLLMLFELAKVLKIDKKSLLNSIQKIKTKNSFPIPFDNIKLNMPLLRILGHLIGDGGIHVVKNEGKYRAFYVNNQEELLNSFKSDIKSIFNEERIIYFRRREKRGDEIWLPSTAGHLFYTLLEYEKFKQKRVPQWIKEIENTKLASAFLQALYDDEGFLYPIKKMIVISLSKYELLKEIRDLVLKMEIKPNKILIYSPKDRSRMYYFSITGKENITKFKENIGFLHPIKRKKLDLLLNSYR